MRKRILAVTTAAALFAVVAAPAAAEPMKPKPKTPTDRTLTVKVTNWLNADLVELQATPRAARLPGRKC
jgi:hypothetical protein